MAVVQQTHPLAVHTGQPEIVGQAVQIQVGDPRHKHKNTLRGLGITEVVLGSLSVVFATAAIGIAATPRFTYHNYDGYGYYGPAARVTASTYPSQGIWCGIIVIITGILGIRVQKKPTKCLYIANMIMAIITANITFVVIILSGIASAAASYHSVALVFMHASVCLLSFVSMILTITHSAFCCSGACYNPRYGVPQQVMYVAQPNMTLTQPQYVQGPNGQLLMVANPPMQSSVAVTQPTMIQGPAQQYPQVASPPYSPTASAAQYDPVMPAQKIQM